MVRAVRDWPTPDYKKQLQHFLGFSNFYRKFIKNFSSIATPLHALTSSVHSRFACSKKAEEAFQLLKGKFTSAPILTLPDPKLQFIVEVDSSDVGIGAVLSQRSQKDNWLHPCAFLTRKLSPAERNYIRNQELLADTFALEKWEHWLEGGGATLPGLD